MACNKETHLQIISIVTIDTKALKVFFDNVYYIMSLLHL